MYWNPMRDKYVWEKISPGRKREMRAGYVYTVDSPMRPRNREYAGSKRRLILAAIAAVPIALVIIQVVAAAAGH